MLRSANSGAARVAGVRSIVGVAPVIYLGKPKAKLAKEGQVEKNTNIAIDMIRRFKGAVPKPYTRKHTKSFEEVEKEVELLLGGAEKMRRKVTDEQPMDKLTVMERTLRHAIWQYKKDEGKYDFAELEKWLVYTAGDEQRIGQLKREVELKQKYAAFKAKRAESGAANAPMPAFKWATEYSKTIDRELVVEKRLRYDVMAANSTERDESKIESVLSSYRKPVQDERVDKIVDLLERFKPILAREAIIQRLTIKHLEGQLGVWRYMDWMPEVRDRAELEADNYCHHWWQECEEKRLLAIRLRSKTEVRDVMEKKQQEQLASQKSSGSSAAKAGGKDDSARAKLLAEVLALQARVHRAKEDDKPAKKEEAHH
jgi:hypothetical protein